MGGLEKVAYDSKEKILYGVSEQGFVSPSSGAVMMYHAAVLTRLRSVMCGIDC